MADLVADLQTGTSKTPAPKDDTAAARQARLEATRTIARLEADLQGERLRGVTVTQERDETRRKLRKAEKGQADLTAELDRIRIFREGGDHQPPPPWLTPKVAKGRARRGIPTLVLSDMHFDEVIDPAEVEGANAYDRDIAELRLKKTLTSTIHVVRDYMQGLKFDGFNLLLLGDGMSGNIHEELKETNAAPLLASFHHWQVQLEGFILGLAEEFGNVHCVETPGNHGRNSYRSRFKGRAEDNFDWLLATEIAHSLRTDKRISFDIPTSMDANLDVYSTKFKLTHGDQFHGGSGIAGIYSPLSLGQHRKTRRELGLQRLRGETGAGFDWMVMGHFHQYIHGRGLIVNGSLKGYDEYAYGMNFEPEVPTQAFWITTPEHGITQTAPIYCQDRKTEGW